MRVLVVEDEERIANLLRMYLQREGFHVDVVDNGDVGAKKALEEQYGVIILDVLMPGKDGFMVLEEIRKQKSTPVILLSAKYGEEEQQRGRDLGVNEYIPKPFSPSVIVTKIKEIIQ